MASVAVWLAALLPSLVGRVLAALGLGVVTVTGFNIAWDSLKSLILTNFGGMSADIMGLANLAGVGEGLGIILGAITARVTFTALMSAKKIAGI
ncbi:MAG: hypothetical protein B7X79_16120 [Acidovorax sp. 17-64-282]|uniref:DUF2523 domain-containing protein n=1 Tax=Acidovorax sp. TaxID=1872122 RepID=UPI000BD5CDC3|nr:DUF2523 domain-containing protein [Acidovorax sp.]OZA55091.1 MAG: hypothetical protein B7X79_16120 [Acidovorax sp. 17-64-282]